MLLPLQKILEMLKNREMSLNIFFEPEIFSDYNHNKYFVLYGINFLNLQDQISRLNVVFNL